MADVERVVFTDGTFTPAEALALLSQEVESPEATTEPEEAEVVVEPTEEETLTEPAAPLNADIPSEIEAEIVEAMLKLLHKKQR